MKKNKIKLVQVKKLILIAGVARLERKIPRQRKYKMQND